MGIETYRYQKIIVLALLTMVKIFDLIYIPRGLNL